MMSEEKRDGVVLLLLLLLADRENTHTETQNNSRNTRVRFMYNTKVVLKRDL